MRRVGVATALAALALWAMASSAGASVTIGQTQDTPGSCSPDYDWVQPTVSAGNTYVVPATVVTGTITGWSSFANSFGGTMTMKVFRHVSGSTYMVVGHDGPRTQTPSILNTFSGFSIPVKAGDVLGVHTDSGFPRCVFDITGDAVWYDPSQSNLADGEQGNFQPDVEDRLNLTAVVDPANAFNIGATARNKKKGTATLPLSLPNPGQVVVSGKGVKGSSKSVGPGSAKVKIKAKGKKRRALDETGKVNLAAKVTYTPTGGDPSARTRKVKLQKLL
jgi:hypothetical protein